MFSHIRLLVSVPDSRPQWMPLSCVPWQKSQRSASLRSHPLPAPSSKPSNMETIYVPHWQSVRKRHVRAHSASSRYPAPDASRSLFHPLLTMDRCFVCQNKESFIMMAVHEVHCC